MRLSNKDEDLDELKTFRQLESDNEDEKENSSFVLEQPRDASCIKNLPSNHYLSPVSKLENEIIVEDVINDQSSLNEDGSNKVLMSLKEDDGYSTMQQQDQNCKKNLYMYNFSILQSSINVINDFQVNL